MLNLISTGNMPSRNTIDSRIVLINKQMPAVSGVSDSRITLFKNGKYNLKDAMNWVNDYNFKRLNGKRNIPDTFAYMEWLHMLKVRKPREKTMFCTKNKFL